MNVNLHIGWITAIASLFSVMAGFIGGYFTLSRIQEQHCEKQRQTCATALSLRVDDYYREFAKREVIDEVIKRIEDRLDDIKDSVDYLARRDGYNPKRKGPA